MSTTRVRAGDGLEGHGLAFTLGRMVDEARHDKALRFALLTLALLLSDTAHGVATAQTAAANGSNKTNSKAKCSGKGKAKRRRKGKGKAKLSKTAAVLDAAISETPAPPKSQEVNPSRCVAALMKITSQLAMARSIIATAVWSMPINASANAEFRISESQVDDVFASLVEQACFISLDEVCHVHSGNEGACGPDTGVNLIRKTVTAKESNIRFTDGTFLR